MTKYCTSSSYGIVDDKTVLDPIDDAATANWGGAWRMPTKEEQQELINNCTWIWTVRNGVNGQKVTGKNGHSVFLPCTGCKGENIYNSVGSIGFYWCSSSYVDDPSQAYAMCFLSQPGNHTYGNRHIGLTIRPVCE
jgi:hypothetical protein